VNAGSITGKYGVQAQTLAWRLLEAGWVACVASDYHARGAPQVAAAVAALEPVGGRSLVEALFVDNPRRMLIGAEPVLPPSWSREQSTSWWKRLLARRER
jgi:tyrosine-protein phosphatase YwqE